MPTTSTAMLAACTLPVIMLAAPTSSKAHKKVMLFLIFFVVFKN
jgi:hypothetical protein